jgi:hypothetical protein
LFKILVNANFKVIKSNHDILALGPVVARITVIWFVTAYSLVSTTKYRRHIPLELTFISVRTYVCMYVCMYVSVLCMYVCMYVRMYYY